MMFKRHAVEITGIKAAFQKAAFCFETCNFGKSKEYSNDIQGANCVLHKLLLFLRQHNVRMISDMLQKKSSGFGPTVTCLT